jgi:hypothetical protein
MRKALSLILIAGLALAGLPALAQDFGPNTIWGEVPSGVSGNAANAVLEDTGARVVATAPVIDGKFAFRDVPPGSYVVVVKDGAGNVLATSLGVTFASGATAKAIFDATRLPAAAVAPSGGGIGTTGLILIGAAAVGIATIVLVATNDDDDDNVSPSR